MALKCSMHLANFTSWRVGPLKGLGHLARFDSWQVFGSVKGHVTLGEMSALAKTSELGRTHLAEILLLGGIRCTWTNVAPWRSPPNAPVRQVQRSRFSDNY